MYTTHVLESVHSRLGNVCAFFHVIDVGCHVHHSFVKKQNHSPVIFMQQRLEVKSFCLWLHDLIEAEWIPVSNHTNICCAWQRPMIRWGPSRNRSSRRRPRVRVSAMSSLYLMWMRTVPSCTWRWPTICTLRMLLRNGEMGDHMFSVCACVLRN